MENANSNDCKSKSNRLSASVQENLDSSNSSVNRTQDLDVGMKKTELTSSSPNSPESSLSDRNSNSSSRAIRVMIVEDQEVVKLGILLSVKGSANIQVVGDASDGPSAVKKARLLNPDLIVMDIGLPGFSGIVATEKIKSELGSKILILSSHCDSSSVLSAINAGADGFCLKDISKERLISVIELLSGGGTWLADGLIQSLVGNNTGSTREAKLSSSFLDDLDRKILDTIFEGTSKEDLAEQLGIPVDEAMMKTERVLNKIVKAEKDELGSSQERKLKDGIKLPRVCPECREIVDINVFHCPIDGRRTELDMYVGTTFADRYAIHSVLGSGTGGTVYRAKHKYIDKFVAIKIISIAHLEDLDMLYRFRVEAAATSELQHKNIVPISDFGFTEKGKPFMIMELIDGESLSSILSREKFLKPSIALTVFEQICEALEIAHNNGIVHRDVKPGNVLITDFGAQSMQVKLLDFGIAKLTKPIKGKKISKTEKGLVFGSPYYMSPEQCLGDELDPLSDIFSFGCLMYVTLVGHPPVGGSDVVDLMYKKLHEETPDIASTTVGKELPLFIQDLVMSTLKLKKSDRVQSVSLLLERIRENIQNLESNSTT